MDINSLVDADEDDVIGDAEDDALDFGDPDDVMAEEEGRLVAA